MSGQSSAGGQAAVAAGTDSGGSSQGATDSGGTQPGGTAQGGSAQAGTAPDPGSGGDAAAAGAPNEPVVPYECRDRQHASTVNGYGFSMRDAFMLMPCVDVSQHDCLTFQGQCPGSQAAAFEDQGLVQQETFKVGGEVGRTYTARIRVSGIVSGKYYTGGMRDRGQDFSDADAPNGTDTFYRGGAPVPSSYDVYKITVRNPDASELQHYYLNSFPKASGYEVHRTFPIYYEKDIDLPGGGSVEYRTQDSNCRAINNCGPGDNGPNCPAARLLPNEPGVAVPASWQGQPVASLNVVNGANQPFHAAIVHLSLVSIVEKTTGEDCTATLP